jgi:hypothetical protein
MDAIMICLYGRNNDLFVGTQDLCVQSNKTGSNKTIPIRMDTLDWALDWTGRKDLASLQKCFLRSFKIVSILNDRGF